LGVRLSAIGQMQCPEGQYLVVHKRNKSTLADKFLTQSFQ
jgi:hypothetical protein